MKKHQLFRPTLIAIALLSLQNIFAAETANVQQDSLLREAISWRQMGNLHHAVYLLSAIPSPEAQLELASTYHLLGEQSKALDICRRLAAENSALRLETQVLMGQCRRAQGFDFAAKRLFRRALRDGSSNAGFQLAQLYFDKGHFAEAEQFCQQAIQLNPHNAQAHLLLSLSLEARSLRFEAMLPLYYYLLIASGDEQKTPAYELLVELWCHRSAYIDLLGRPRTTTSKFNHKINLLLDQWTTDDSIAAATPQQQIQILADRTAQLFKHLAATSTTNLDFYQLTYTDLYLRLLHLDFLQALIYHIVPTTHRPPQAPENYNDFLLIAF